MVCLGLVDHQQPPAILEFRPNSRPTSKWITVSSVEKKKCTHSFQHCYQFYSRQMDLKMKKTLSVIVAAAAAAAAAVFCLAAFVHTSGTSAELTA